MILLAILNNDCPIRPNKSGNNLSKPATRLSPSGIKFPKINDTGNVSNALANNINGNNRKPFSSLSGNNGKPAMNNGRNRTNPSGMIPSANDPTNLIMRFKTLLKSLNGVTMNKSPSNANLLIKFRAGRIVQIGIVKSSNPLPTRFLTRPRTSLTMLIAHNPAEIRCLPNTGNTIPPNNGANKFVNNKLKMNNGKNDNAGIGNNKVAAKPFVINLPIIYEASPTKFPNVNGLAKFLIRFRSTGNAAS